MAEPSQEGLMRRRPLKKPRPVPSSLPVASAGL